MLGLEKVGVHDELLRPRRQLVAAGAASTQAPGRVAKGKFRSSICSTIPPSTRWRGIFCRRVVRRTPMGRTLMASTSSARRPASARASCRAPAASSGGRVVNALRDADVRNARNGFEVAIVGMSGRFPGARNLDTFWRNVRDGVESIAHFTDSELIAAGAPAGALDDPLLRQGLGRAGGCRPVRRRILRLHAAGGGDHRSATPSVPGMRLGGPGGRGLWRRRIPGMRRGLCRRQLEHLPPAQSPPRCRSPAVRRRSVDDHRQRQGLSRDRESPTSST